MKNIFCNRVLIQFSAPYEIGCLSTYIFTQDKIQICWKTEGAGMTLFDFPITTPGSSDSEVGHVKYFMKGIVAKQGGA